MALRILIGIENLNMFDSLPFKGINLRWYGQTTRSFCQCGFVSPLWVKECPECGNTSWESTDDMKIRFNDENKDGVEVIKEEFKSSTHEIVSYYKNFVNLETTVHNKVNIALVKDSFLKIESIDGKFVSMTKSNISNDIIEKILENKDILPLWMEQLVKIMETRKLRSISFEEAVGVLSGKTNYITFMNDLLTYPIEVIKSLENFYGEDYAKRYTCSSLIEYLLKLGMEEEFLPCFFANPSDFIRYISYSHWNPRVYFGNLPEYLKNLMTYYYINGVIDYSTMFNINKCYSKCSSTFNDKEKIVSYMRKYAAVPKQMNAIENVRLWQQDVGTDIFDFKEFNNYKNFNAMMCLTSYEQRDFDEFVNNFDEDPLSAYSNLAKSKKKK